VSPTAGLLPYGQYQATTHGDLTPKATFIEPFHTIWVNLFDLFLIATTFFKLHLSVVVFFLIVPSLTTGFPVKYMHFLPVAPLVSNV
jgi:hypothetical protein